MLELLVFKQGHMDFFCPTEEYKSLIHIYEPWLHELGKMGQAGVHMKDGKILYLSGYFEVCPGTWEVMIVPSVHLAQYKLSVVKDIKRWLQSIAHARGARRMQTWGEPNAVSDRWLACLGFTCEGTLVDYCEEGDKRIWRWLP